MRDVRVPLLGSKASKLLVFLIFIGVGTESRAGCEFGETLDLRVLQPQIWDRLDITDQGKVGVCYAHAAATLIDYFRLHLRTEAAGHWPTQPLDAAQVGTLQAGSGDIEGGEVCEVVEGMVSRGYGQARVPYSPQKLLDLGIQVQREVVGRVYLPYINDPKSFKPVAIKKPGRLSREQKSYIKNFNEFYAWLLSELKRRNIEEWATPSSEKVFEMVQNNHVQNDYANFPVKFEMMMSDAAASPTSAARFKIPELRCFKEKSYSSGADYFPTIDRAIGIQKQPIGVDLCSNSFRNPKYRAYESAGKIRKDCQAHAVVLIGRRFHRSQCEYLVRNSWGTEDQWVSESTLKNSIFGTNWVKPSGR